MCMIVVVNNMLRSFPLLQIDLFFKLKLVFCHFMLNYYVHIYGWVQLPACGWFPSTLLLNYHVHIVYYRDLIENAICMLLTPSYT